MNRSAFIKNIIRLTLLGILAGMAVFLGGKVVTGENCESCPGSGVCKGKTDCSKFLSDNYGRKDK